MEKKPVATRGSQHNRARKAALWPSSLPAACPFCGETTEVAVDVSGGQRQTYLEDCVVCCRPSMVHLATNERGDPSLWLERADG